MSMFTLVFEIHRDGELLRTERIDREIVKIGNLPTSHLHLDDSQVSGIHAVIEVTGDTVNLIDLGSTYGTRVNGERVNRHELSDGDELELGNTKGPNNPDKNKNSDGFYECTVRTLKKVWSTDEMFKERKCNITNGAGYGLKYCYRDTSDMSTLEFWVIHKSK